MDRQPETVSTVSILVLLEFSLKDEQPVIQYLEEKRFNPCFIGIQSEGVQGTDMRCRSSPGFNPCFIGIQSEGISKSVITIAGRSFNPCFIGIQSEGLCFRW